MVVLLAAGILGAGCASTSCAGVGFDSSVNVNLASLHRHHPGVLTVQLCIDGACSSSQLQATDDSWAAPAAPTITARHITVQITDPTGWQIFSDNVDNQPTKVIFNPGQCDEQTSRNSAVAAGQDGKLTNVVVVPTVVTFNAAATTTG